MKQDVTEWPTYLLVGLPDELREQVSEEAMERNLSVSDTIRQVLCAHYRLRCHTPQGSVYRTEAGERITLRLPPKLWYRIKRDTNGRYGEIRKLLVRVLERHYAKKEAVT